MRRKEKKRGRREMAEGNGDGKLRKGDKERWVLGGGGAICKGQHCEIRSQKMRCGRGHKGSREEEEMRWRAERV